MRLLMTWEEMQRSAASANVQRIINYQSSEKCSKIAEAAARNEFFKKKSFATCWKCRLMRLTASLMSPHSFFSNILAMHQQLHFHPLWNFLSFALSSCGWLISKCNKLILSGWKEIFHAQCVCITRTSERERVERDLARMKCVLIL